MASKPNDKVRIAVVGMGIDINTRKPKLYTNYGGLSGPAIKPIAIVNVHKVFKAVKIPVIGIGGISTVEDVIEFLLAGATLVQIGTMNYQNPNIGSELRTELDKYLMEESIEDVQDLIGRIKYHSK